MSNYITHKTTDVITHPCRILDPISRPTSLPDYWLGRRQTYQTTLVLQLVSFVWPREICVQFSSLRIESAILVSKANDHVWDWNLPETMCWYRGCWCLGPLRRKTSTPRHQQSYYWQCTLWQKGLLTLHYNDITKSITASQITAIRRLIQPFVQANTKENTKAHVINVEWHSSRI